MGEVLAKKKNPSDSEKNNCGTEKEDEGERRAERDEGEKQQ